jgi:transcriptional regulator with XRE-family HTH domain
MSQLGEPRTLGERIRLRRLEMGLTQEDLARRSRVTISTIRNIERGRTERSYRLRDVLRVLGMVDDETAELERRYYDRLRAIGVDERTAAKEAREMAADPTLTPPGSRSGNDGTRTA